MPLATVETNKSVKEYVDSIQDETKRKDTKELIKIVQKITGKKPKIWGDNYIIAFGKYKYKRKGGKEEFEWFNIGFAPRKNNISIYITCYLTKEQKLLDQLGKYKCGKGCLYINKLDDINLDVLKKLLEKYKDHTWYS